ncbi:tRNA methyl transferase PRC-barrel domain-containing protein [Mobiluncus mulieris]|uniref:tRNA methyl transferase PRC-barrel domain-containing protein n=1 Tax=Mobiluncus mulieris TaxID=2052 RepID=UPI002093BC43|nr:tRNA methyl transferase PRC-barrel domain-containing protein [Mobiluncus mulieris]
MLAGARAEMLAHAIFPLFDVRDKAETRAEAQRRGLPVARKRDSFDICFIHDGDTRGFLRGKLGGAQPGAIVDENGAVVGQHLGAFLYTVGQRRGLHLPRPTKMASHAMLPGWM